MNHRKEGTVPAGGATGLGLCLWSFSDVLWGAQALRGTICDAGLCIPSQGGDDPRQNWDAHLLLPWLPFFSCFTHPKLPLYPSTFPHGNYSPCVSGTGAVPARAPGQEPLGKVTFLGPLFPSSHDSISETPTQISSEDPLHSAPGKSRLRWHLFSDGSLCLFFLQGMDDKSIFRSEVFYFLVSQFGT